MRPTTDPTYFQGIFSNCLQSFPRKFARHTALFLALLATLCVAWTPQAQAQTLSKGDIVVAGMNPGTDTVLLVPLVDLQVGTVINITDVGILSSNAFHATLTGDGNVAWTVTGSVVPKGSLLKLVLGGSDNTPANELTNLSTSTSYTANCSFTGFTVTDPLLISGDQIIIYQGTMTSPSFIFGLNNSGAAVDAANWNNVDTPTLIVSKLPPGLTNGTDAIGLPGNSSQQDNVQYTGPTGAATREIWQQRFTTLANWGGDSNASPGTTTNSITSTGISITAPSAAGVLAIGTPASNQLSSSLAFTVPAGTNRLLVVHVAQDLVPTIPVPTYNGQTMTLGVHKDDGTVAGDSIFYLKLGDGDKIVSTIQSNGGSNTAFIGASAYTNVDQTTPVTSPQSFNSLSSGNSPGLTVTSATGDLVIDMVDSFQATTETPGGGQTQVHSQSIPTHSAFYKTTTKPGAASVTMSWTSNGTAIIHAAINIKSRAAFTAPTVSTGSATGVTSTSATINGTIDPQGVTAVSTFDFGFSTSYSFTFVGSPVTVTGGSTAVSQTVSGLSPNTTYFYRANAINGTTVNGSGGSFTTLAALSSNADLSALSLSAGSISFAAGTTSYSFNVANATTSTTVTATKADANATLQVQVNGGGFTALNSGSASGPLSLNVGPNTVNVKVTAQDGSTTKTYTTTINRAASSNADLSALSFSAGSISFSAGTTGYSFNVPNATTSTTVTATKADANATLQVQVNSGGFSALNSGSASGPLSLNVGNNTVDVKVTAQDGSTIKTYTTTVTRAVALPAVTSSTANLNANAASFTIAGTNFDAAFANNTVTLSSGTAHVTGQTGQTSLNVAFDTAPKGGPLTAVVTTPAGNSGAAVQVATVIPVITSSTANLANNATSLTISGVGFDATAANNSVTFSPSGTGTITSATSTSVTVTGITGLTNGTLNAVVTTNGAASASTQVATVGNPAPTVTLTTTVVNATATTITINGTGFNATTPSDNVVTFSPGGTGTVTAAIATRLTVTGVTGLRGGPLSAVVTNSNGSSGAAVQVSTVRPVITASTTPIGTAATSLVINGAGFDPNPGNNTVAFSPSGTTGTVTASTTTSLTVTGLTGLTTGALSATVTTNGTASTGTQVAGVIPQSPIVSVAFGAASIPAGGITTLTYTLTNPYASQALTGVAFTDVLPTGLVVATPNGLSSTAGGTVTALAGTNVISLTGGTITTNGTATITVNVTSSVPGVKTGMYSVATSTEAPGMTNPSQLGTSYPALNISTRTFARQIYTGTFTAADPTQNGRVTRDGTASQIGTADVFPGILTAGTAYHYDTISIPNTTGVAQDVQVWTNCAGGSNGFCVTYLGSFNPASIGTNYLADAGSTFPTTGSYGFTIPAGQTALIVVSETVANGGGSYVVGVNTPIPDTPALVASLPSLDVLAAPSPTVTASSAALLNTATSLTIIGTNFNPATPGNNTVAFSPSGTGIVTASTATTLTVTSLTGLTAGALNAVVTTNGQNSGAPVQVATVVQAPSVAATNPNVTVDEGSTASNTGTFSGQAGDTITISASSGTVTQDAGTWSWSATALDGPLGPTTITITATDSTNSTSTNTTFTVTVNNVAPSISLSGNASVVANVSYQLNFSGITDPGVDTVTDYAINWGDGSPTDIRSGNPANGNALHTYTSAGSYTITATITDEDGTYNAGNSVSVSVASPQAYTVDLNGPRTDGQTTPAADFGSTTAGNSVQKTLTIANPAGNPSLLVSSITVPTGFRVGTTAPQTIPAGDSLSLDVFFEPADPGAFSGNLVIHTNAAGSLADFSFAITGAATPEVRPSDDYFFAAAKAITCDVLANDHTDLSGSLTIASVTQPAANGTTRILNGRIVYTPRVRVTTPVTFNYTVTNGSQSLTPKVTIFPTPAAGFYVGLLTDSTGAVKGRINLTLTATGACTGLLRTDGSARSITGGIVNSGLIVYGYRTPGLLTLVPPAGYDTAAPTLAAKIGVPVLPALLTGVLERSPYDGTHPAPQAGRYTMLAKLPAEGTGPKIGAVLTSTIAPNGTVTFVGKLGEGTAVGQGGALLSGGRLPFYFGAKKAGAIARLSGELVFDRNASPKVSGTLHWLVSGGFSTRLASVDQDYTVLGAPYTPAATGTTMLSLPGGQATLTLEMPTISSSPRTFTYLLDGPIRRGNVQWVVQGGIVGRLGGYYLTLGNGIYYGYYLGPQNKHRDFFGVVLQGPGLNYGEGYTLDLNSLGSSSLKPTNSPQ